MTPVSYRGLPVPCTFVIGYIIDTSLKKLRESLSLILICVKNHVYISKKVVVPINVIIWAGSSRPLDVDVIFQASVIGLIVGHVADQKGVQDHHVPDTLGLQ